MLPRYTISDLGPGFDSVAIAPSGAIVGFMATRPGVLLRGASQPRSVTTEAGTSPMPPAPPWLSDNTIWRPLNPAPGDAYCHPHAINASHAVVGVTGTTGGRHVACSWMTAVGTPLGTLGGARSSAAAVDDSATIVGIAQTTEGAFHACLWERGIAHDLGTLGGRRSEAFAIGASRQTVGEAQLREGGYRAFLHTPATGMVALLGEIAHAYSSARAISTASHIVGHYSRQGRGGGMRGFVWREGLLLDLPAPTGYDSAGADAVNADGLIVGNTWNVGQTTQDSRAVFWDATGGHFLQDLLDEAHGWHLLTASSVNDIGEIVGLGKYGADYRGYLLRPRPS